ncbi:MAG: NAD-dependent epimerase/dehydratase family protein [Acidobacteria bacterium]|nr:NAD-dependent epimerase/dehydratase family protein [Acidobacteriota bacterium]
MRLLITGACGFVAAELAEALLGRIEGLSITGIDNLMRPGAAVNVDRLRRLGVRFVHGDIRMASDMASLPAADWVIDAAANPSVLAGVDGKSSSRQLFEHNLASIANVLEYCRTHSAGLFLLSSSRVYNIPALCGLPLRERENAYVLDESAALPHGITADGIGPEFSTAVPVSLYGATKLSCEVMALEYGATFDFPVWVTRCGVLAGAGQFGTPAQGIFAYWINAHLRRRPMRYVGFNGQGLQARDALHPRDLAALLAAQMGCQRRAGQRVYTAGGGVTRCRSLAQLTEWCDGRFGAHRVESDPRPRPFDIPWVAMSNADATRDFGWRPEVSMDDLLEGIAHHAAQHPEWLELSGV